MKHARGVPIDELIHLLLAFPAGYRMWIRSEPGPAHGRNCRSTLMCAFTCARHGTSVRPRTQESRAPSNTWPRGEAMPCEEHRERKGAWVRVHEGT